MKLESGDDLLIRLARDEISLNADQLKALYKKQASLLRKVLRNPFASRKAKDNDGKDDGPIEKIDRTSTFILHPDTENPNYIIEPCCSPIPGDDVLGFVNDDEQVVLHKVECPVAMRLKTNYGPRLVSTEWGGSADKFLATISIEGIDRRGILEDITVAVSQRLNINIRSLSIAARHEVFQCELMVQVANTDIVETILSHLKEIKGIQKAFRI